MALKKGLYASDLASRVLFDLGDPAQKRWSADQVLKFINEGVRELAGEGIFRRFDLHIPQAGKAVYETFAEYAVIGRVEYGFCELEPLTEAEAESRLGHGWRLRMGAPRFFIPMRTGVRLAPAPGNGGTPLQFSGTPSITEENGGKINGEGLIGALWENSVAHFAEGDGFAANWPAASGNLLIEYAFFPRPSESGDLLPSRLADALVAYSTARCLALSDAEEDLARVGAATGRWLSLRERLVQKNGVESLCEPKNFAPLEAL